MGMRRVGWFAGLLVLLLIPLAYMTYLSRVQSRDGGWTHVRYVYDGDTIAVDGTDGQTRVRLLGIDAPEVAHRQDGSADQPFGPEAADILRQLLPEGEPVRLEYDERKFDQYGRVLAYVWDKDGGMLNEKMLRLGYARVLILKPNTRYAVRFNLAEGQARLAGAGMWKGRMQETE